MRLVFFDEQNFKIVRTMETTCGCVAFYPFWSRAAPLLLYHEIVKRIVGMCWQNPSDILTSVMHLITNFLTNVANLTIEEHLLLD